MSKPSDSLQDPDPGLPNIVVSAAAIVGALFIGVLVIALAYSGTRVPTVAEDGPSDAERWEFLRSRMDQEQRELSQYGWVNRSEGVVRLPIEAAMEKTILAISRGEDPLPSRAMAVETPVEETEAEDSGESAPEEMTDPEAGEESVPVEESVEEDVDAPTLDTEEAETADEASAEAEKSGEAEDGEENDS